MSGCLVLTREERAEDILVHGLRGKGWPLRCVAVLEYESLEEEVAPAQIRDSLSADAWVLSSPRAVGLWQRCLEKLGTDLEQVQVPVLAVGPGTAAECNRLGREPERIALRSQAEGMAEVLLAWIGEGGVVVHPSNRARRKVLGVRLEAAGMSYHSIDLYSGSLRREASEELKSMDVRAVVVTSAGAHHALMELAQLDVPHLAIGPVTQASMEDSPRPALASAPRPTAAGIDAALRRIGLLPRHTQLH